MKLLDKEGLTYYTSKVKGQLATKQPLINNDNKLSASLVSGLSAVATSGSYNDLTNKPAILKIVVIEEVGKTSSFNFDSQSNREKLLEVYNDYSNIENYNIVIKTHSVSSKDDYNYFNATVFSYDSTGFWITWVDANNSDTSSYGISCSKHSKITLYVKYQNENITQISTYKNQTKFFINNADYGFALGLNNTTSYTPTGDYNPATKKYVDDIVGNIDTLLTTLDIGGGV